jgi:hypothetical protein
MTMMKQLQEGFRLPMKKELVFGESCHSGQRCGSPHRIGLARNVSDRVELPPSNDGSVRQVVDNR